MFVDADYGMPIDPCLLGAFDEERGAAGPRPQELDERDMFLLNLPTAGKAIAGTVGVNGSGASGAQTPTSEALPLNGEAPETATTGLGPQSSIKKAGLQRPASTPKRTFDHSLEGQLQAIDESFKYYAKYGDHADGEQELLRDLRHATNSSLRAVEAIPIFPDEDLWANNYS
ncbi:hypothetical protein GGF44_004244, partial [Coemansia sp. RSA 1694]